MRREHRGSREDGSQSGLKMHGEHGSGRDGLVGRALVGADMLKSSTAEVVDVHQWEVGSTSGAIFARSLTRSALPLIKCRRIMAVPCCAVQNVFLCITYSFVLHGPYHAHSCQVCDDKNPILSSHTAV